MEKNNLTCLMIFVLIVLPFMPVQAQQRKNLVQERLRADMRELKNQLGQLNRTVNQLETAISRLKKENQRLKNRLIKVERQVDRRPTRSRTRSKKQEQSSRSANEKTSAQETTSGQSDNDKWVSAPGHPYQIRQTPLDHRVIYVTTDDTTLTKLAHKYYRNASLWKTIYEVNKDKLPSPDVIPPGINLVLPPIKNLK